MAGKNSILFALVLANVFASVAWGEDIDLYVNPRPTPPPPNVLLFLDDTSNWSTAKQNWSYCAVYANCGADTACQGYANTIFGTNPTTAQCSSKKPKDVSLAQGQVEAGALQIVLNELVCNAAKPLDINVGLMGFQANGTIGAANGSSAISGYIRHAVLPLTSGTGSPCDPNQSQPPSLIYDLAQIKADINRPAYKGPSSAGYGGPLFEAFKYFGGYTDPARANNDSPSTPNDGEGTPISSTAYGPQRYEKLTGFEDPLAFTDGSKTTYLSPINSSNHCGRNYVVLVGNGYPAPDADSKTIPPGTLSSSFSGTSCCGMTADLWANFLATTDVNSAAGQQTVFTYTVNVSNTKPDASQIKLLKSMAINGGTGLAGYFEVGGRLQDLINSFKDIFTSIAAVNSVFASSSLPVSVNTQGTFLNQVFIGMFRPDADALERWAGNLKQYQFALDKSTTPSTLFLADSTGAAAVDSGNTGFIKQCAVSFWTQDTGMYWQNVPVSQTPRNGCGAPPAPNSTASVFSDWPDGNLVEKGGASQWLRTLTCGPTQSPTWCGRNIQTCKDTTCSSLVDFNTTNVTNLTSSSGSSTLVNWVAGGNLGDGPKNNSGDYQFYNQVDNTLAAKARPTVHGGVVHGRPMAINYGTGATNDVVVYYGAGDGMLHAIDGNQTPLSGSSSIPGQELWAFLAPEFFPSSTLTLLDRLREDSPLISYPTISTTLTPTPTRRDYYFDGTIGAYQQYKPNGGIEKIWIYPTMRRGGRMIYAFDATNRPSTSQQPKLKWKFGCPYSMNKDTTWNDNSCIGGGNVTNIGQTWSAPRIITVKGSSTLYAVFGGGYDHTCEDADVPTCTTSSKGTGIFVLDADAGSQMAYIDLAAITTDGHGNAITAGRVAADVTPVDVDGDGNIDVIYSVDTRGNVWRTNTTDVNGNGLAPSSWTTYPLAYVSDWSQTAKSRKFEYAPDVVSLGPTTNLVLLGSGDREHPLGSSTAAKVVNRFYGLRDNYLTIPGNAVIYDGNDCDRAGDTDLDPGCALLNVTDTSLDYSAAVLSAQGWVFDLSTLTANTKEQVITTPVTIGGKTFFNTFQPTDASQPAQQCSNLGTARGYEVNFLTGGLATGSLTSRSTTYTGGGLPPSPVAGLVSVGGEVVPFILGGKPLSGSGSAGSGSALGGQNLPLGITPVRSKAYRYKAIDTQ